MTVKGFLVVGLGKEPIMLIPAKLYWSAAEIFFVPHPRLYFCVLGAIVMVLALFTVVVWMVKVYAALLLFPLKTSPFILVVLIIFVTSLENNVGEECGKLPLAGLFLAK